MSKNKIEKGIINPSSLKRKLWNLRFKFILPEIIILVIFLLLRGMNYFVWEYDWILCLIIIVAPLVARMISDYRPDCIYHFNKEDRNVNLFLINVFGMKKCASISLDEVCEIEYDDKGLWRENGKIWIHFEKRVEEFSFIDDSVRKELKDKLDLGKEVN